MERRFESRREAVLADCQVPPAVFNRMMERLVNFACQWARQNRPRMGALEPTGEQVSPTGHLLHTNP